MKPINEKKEDLNKEIENIDKMESYLKAKKEIFDFVIRSKVLHYSLFYLSVVAVILAIGGNAFIEYKIKDGINTMIADRINDEAQYLEQRNKITQLGDIAISKGSMNSYRELEKIHLNNSDEKIRQGADAEIKRVESFMSDWFNYYPENKLEHINKEGKIIVGHKIPTPILKTMLLKSKDIGKITTILQIIYDRREKDLPQFLLKVARETFHLRIRFVALRDIQYLVEDFTANPYNYENFEQWWQVSGKSIWEKKTKNR